MPGETDPSSGPEAFANITPEQRAAEVAKQTIQAGPDKGKLTDDTLAWNEAHAELKARDDKAAELGYDDPNNLTYRTKKGEFRQENSRRGPVTKAREELAKIGEAAADEAADKYSVNAVIERGFVKNYDQALEMAYAEKAEREMAKNLTDIGSENLAEGKIEAAKQHGLETGASYEDAATRGLGDVRRVIAGEKLAAVLEGKDLSALQTVIQGFAGKGAEPIFEQTKGRGKHAYHEAFFASSTSPNVVMVQRSNARTGEAISLHTLATRSEALHERKGVRIPTRELNQELGEARKYDNNPENEATQAPINSRATKLNYNDVGEYNFIQNRRLDVSKPETKAELRAYRARRQKQRKAVPWWSRLFS